MAKFCVIASDTKRACNHFKSALISVNSIAVEEPKHGEVNRTFVLFFGENPQAVVYSAQPLCWSGLEITPPPLTGEQYGKMEPKYPKGSHC